MVLWFHQPSLPMATAATFLILPWLILPSARSPLPCTSAVMVSRPWQPREDGAHASPAIFPREPWARPQPHRLRPEEWHCPLRAEDGQVDQRRITGDGTHGLLGE